VFDERVRRESHLKGKWMWERDYTKLMEREKRKEIIGKNGNGWDHMEALMQWEDMESRREKEEPATIGGKRDTEQHNVGKEKEEEAREQECKDEEKDQDCIWEEESVGKGYKGKGGGKDGPGKGTVFSGKCQECGIIGHSAKFCPKLGKGFQGTWPSVQ
jgi:NDP-sugar pyrophosphorylase family protein